MRKTLNSYMQKNETGKVEDTAQSQDSYLRREDCALNLRVRQNILAKLRRGRSGRNALHQHMTLA